MDFRRANLNDLNIIEKLMRTKEFKNSDGTYPDKNYLSKYLNSDLFIVAVENENILGCIYGERLIGNGVLLWYIVVNQDFRRKGIGSNLLIKFEKICKSIGIKFINLCSPINSKENINFYKKHKYEQEGSYIEFYKEL